MALAWDISEMRVATKRGWFALERGPQGFLNTSYYELHNDWWTLFHLVAPKILQQAQKDFVTQEEANHQMLNTIWTRLAPKYGWIYRRSKKASP